MSFSFLINPFVFTSGDVPLDQRLYLSESVTVFNPDGSKITIPVAITPQVDSSVDVLVRIINKPVHVIDDVVSLGSTGMYTDQAVTSVTLVGKPLSLIEDAITLPTTPTDTIAISFV